MPQRLPTPPFTFGAALVLAFGLWAGCGTPPPGPQRDYSAEVAALADEAWQRLFDQSPYLQIKHGQLLRELPDLTPQQAAENVAQARSLLERIDAIPTESLTENDTLTLAVLRWDAERSIESEPFYWLSFPVTPYAAGFGMNFINQAIATYPFDDPEKHREGYLTLLSEYGDQLEQAKAHLEGQIERGILVPKPALPGIIALFEAFEASVPSLMVVAPERLEAFSPEERATFQAEVEDIITGRIKPAFKAVLDLLGSEDYQGRAPEAVGLAQYPDGEDYYHTLVKLYTTMDVTPQELHELGKKKVEELSAKMAAIRAELGFSGTQAEFHDQIRQDPRFLAKTPEDVEARFNEYIRRIEPRVSEYFSRTPKAPYGVRRLDPASEGSMTYGYYEETTGHYLYNGSQLDQRSLIFAGPLIYHELVPGHHFHLALQSENTELPMYRREYAAAGAFNEGWGNYGALLAGEMGLLDDPYERYGWAVFDMFISVRLVVDTGMNLMGWSLEEGRDYMRQHTFQSETEISTESLRYSTDLHGQALGYKAGLEKILELREKARAKAGESFDIREFHQAMLGSGAMPMAVLEQHVDWYFGERAAKP